MPASFDVAVVGAGLGAAPPFAALADLRADGPLTWVCARDTQRLDALVLPEGVRRTEKPLELDRRPLAAFRLHLRHPRRDRTLANRAFPNPTCTDTTP